MKKIILLFFCAFLSTISYSQISRMAEVIVGGSTSSAGSAPLTSQRYQRVAYLIPSSELTAPISGMTVGAVINKIGFVFCGSSEIPVTGTFKVWLQNTSDATYTKSTTIDWSSAGGVTDGMTLVHDGNITLPAHTNIVDVAFSGTANTFTYSGTNIYVAFEYTNVAGTIPFASNNTYCNSSTTPTGAANGLRRSISTTAMPLTAATSSAFRPYTRLGYTNTSGSGLTNDAEVVAIYTYGTRPIGSTDNNQVQALIRNNSNFNISNLNVTLNRFGTNTFTNTKTITSLAAGGYSTVTFNADNPTNAGLDSLKVTIPTDNVDSNNVKTIPQIVSPNRYGLAYGLNTAAATAATVATEHLVKFNTTGTITIDSVMSWYNVPAGGATYTITIRKANASGLPESTAMWESAAQTPTGGGVQNAVAVPSVVISPTAYPNGDFYVGIRQTGTASIALFGQQNVEFPLRPNLVYTSTSAVGSLTAFTAGNLNKFFIEPRFSSVVPVNLTIFTGVKNGSTNKLSWITTDEKNNKGFELERSADGDRFSSIEFVASKATNGNSVGVLEYEFIDAKPFKAVSYYRLKQIDFDGKTSYSKVVAIRDGRIVNFDISDVYPNPTTEKINVVVSSIAEKNANFIITDLIGKVVLQQNTKVMNGETNVQLNVSKLTAGNYMLKVVCEDGCEASTKKFIKL